LQESQVAKLLEKSKTGEFLGRLGKDALVLAPVERAGMVLFTAPGEGESVAFDFSNTRNAPKSAFFPQTECMYRYERKGSVFEMADTGFDERPRVLFAVRPCDAKSFTILDRLFVNKEFIDPYYKAKRDSSVVFALGCASPCRTCFCTSLDCGPFSTEGADVFMTDLGEKLLLEPLTEKGQKAVAELPDADSKLLREKESIANQAVEMVSTEVELGGLPDKLRDIFEHPVWAEISQRCLGCGACTYLCPTCHCFDIQDEVLKGRGRRVRNWDSCMFPLFTLHGSGHNPRTQQSQRWRQRLQHKFNYYVENFGCTACVGCGRCIVNCPVNIDIREVIGRVSQAQKVQEGA
jgi:sulfhydrogenase subunit beta (sulfur reductase)